MRTIVHAHLLARVSGVECEGNIECPPTSVLQPRGPDGSAPEEHHGLQLHGPHEAPEDKARDLLQRRQVRVHDRRGRYTQAQLKKYPFLKLLNWKAALPIFFSITMHLASVGLYSFLAKGQLERYYKWAQQLVAQLDGGGTANEKGLECKAEKMKQLFSVTGTGLKFLQGIPDILLDYIGPAHNGAHPIVSLISDWMFTIMMVMGIGAIFATGDVHLIVRCFTVATFLTNLDTISENVTILPPSMGAYKCLEHNKICDTAQYAEGEDCIAYRNRIGQEKDNNYKNITTVSELLGQSSSVEIPLEGTCTAMVFSGHTFRTIMYMWMFLTALQWFKVKWVTEPVILVAMLVVGLIQSILLLVNHEHYSLDIYMAFVLTFMATHFEPLMKFGVWVNPFI